MEIKGRPPIGITPPIIKTCPICKQAKPADQFWRKYHGRCKDCQREFIKGKKRELKLAAIQYKGGKCSLCPESEPVCLEFHHIDPSTKEFEIATAGYLMSGRMKRELDKCVILCSNCHHKVHAGLVCLRMP